MSSGNVLVVEKTSRRLSQGLQNGKRSCSDNSRDVDSDWYPLTGYGFQNELASDNSAAPGCMSIYERCARLAPSALLTILVIHCNEMRLLNTNTEILQLHEFTTNIPEYVILSHTWLNEGEVQFDDVDKPEARDMPGYAKLIAACRQASNDGFEWIWMDTCCINKNSSAELSEAINSMYDWYWKAEICYAYLVDVPINEDHTAAESSFVKSRWWTRGWTLQELLAPEVVEFYDQEWNQIGTKSSLLARIKAVTNIEERHLLNRETIREATIGAIFSWASARKTTRVEDIAYCLLGLVRVNIPLLYGEGARAFYRLQLELLNQTAEHTIFAWDPVEGDDFEDMGILAPAPRNFQHAAHIKIASLPRSVAVNSSYTTHEMTNRGLRISLPRLPVAVGGGDFLAILNCRSGKAEFVGINLQYISREQYRRVPGSKMRRITSDEAFGNYPYTLYIPAESRLRTSFTTSSSKCTIRIGAINISGFQKCEVDGVSFYFGTKASLLDLEPKRIIGDVVLGENQYINLRFVADEVSFAIVLGQHRRMTWFRVISPILKSEMNNALKHLVRKIGDGERPDYIQDHISWYLAPNVNVELLGKKTKVRSPKMSKEEEPKEEGVEVGLCWTVTINIREKKWGTPSEKVEEIRNRLQAVDGWCGVMDE